MYAHSVMYHVHMAIYITLVPANPVHSIPFQSIQFLFFPAPHLFHTRPTDKSTKYRVQKCSPMLWWKEDQKRVLPTKLQKNFFSMDGENTYHLQYIMSYKNSDRIPVSILHSPRWWFKSSPLVKNWASNFQCRSIKKRRRRGRRKKILEM